MPLCLPPTSFTELTQLVTKYNLAEHDSIHQLFYLQKINHLINKTNFDDELFSWVNSNDVNNWQSQLRFYGINPNASLFLKNIQFAQAVAKRAGNVAVNNESKNVYELMQLRDGFLKNNEYKTCKDHYILTSLYLNKLANENVRIKSRVEKQLQILELAADKFEAIKGNSQVKNRKYSTEELGTKQVNNFNFKFKIDDWPNPMVFRVEDRPDLGLDQELGSFEVEKYFCEDFSFFMMEFLNQNKIEYKPVILSEFANQGSLLKVAETLRNTSQAHIVPITVHYFKQISDFCLKLMSANAYHPDIKLANFLVHNNVILVSDRKALINEPNPLIAQVRSSPMYTPLEYRKHIVPQSLGFKSTGYKTTINMPQFMSYLLGMALKEFILLTQLDDIPDDFKETNVDAYTYFEQPSPQMINLFVLIQELTRADANKRLTIKQFQELLYFCNLKPHHFYKKLEEILPAESLGIQGDLDKISKLLNNMEIPRNSRDDYRELVQQANDIFHQVAESKENRLVRLAEELATYCFHEYSKGFFIDCSNRIENALLKNDWEQAPWYRKLAHIFSFGYFRVDSVTDISTLETQIDFKSDEFQFHFPQLKFLPQREFNCLGIKEARHFNEFIVAHYDEIITKPDIAPDPEKLETEEVVEDSPNPKGTVEYRVVKKSDSIKTSTKLLNVLGFFGATDEGTQPRRKPLSIKSAMLRDGSHIRRKSQQQASGLSCG